MQAFMRLRVTAMIPHNFVEHIHPHSVESLTFHSTWKPLIPSEFPAAKVSGSIFCSKYTVADPVADLHFFSGNQKLPGAPLYGPKCSQFHAVFWKLW